jgi:hypothetical protein
MSQMSNMRLSKGENFEQILPQCSPLTHSSKGNMNLLDFVTVYFAEKLKVLKFGGFAEDHIASFPDEDQCKGVKQ